MYQVTELKNSIDRFLEEIERSTGQNSVPDGRRSTRRHDWTGHLVVKFMDYDKSSEPLYLTTRRISPVGLDFLWSGQMEIGKKVVIVFDTEDGELEIPGTVMHCTGSVGRNIIGVKFDLDEGCAAGSECQ